MLAMAASTAVPPSSKTSLYCTLLFKSFKFVQTYFAILAHGSPSMATAAEENFPKMLGL